MKPKLARELSRLFVLPACAESLLLYADEASPTGYRARQALLWLDRDNELPIPQRATESRAEREGLAIAYAFVQAIRAERVSDRLECARIIQAALRQMTAKTTSVGRSEIAPRKRANQFAPQKPKGEGKTKENRHDR